MIVLYALLVINTCYGHSMDSKLILSFDSYINFYSGVIPQFDREERYNLLLWVDFVFMFRLQSSG